MSEIFPEIQFLKESDKLKSVLRKTSLHDGSRRENSAEHSWQLALSVLTFRHLADEEIDLSRAIQMALVHDVVEIDAGDIFVYDSHLMAEKFHKEKAAADRIFGLLPEDGDSLKALWLSYEEQACPESRFVGALDRFLPVFANLQNDGESWREHRVSLEKILERNSAIAKGSKKLWEYARVRIQECHRRRPW